MSPIRIPIFLLMLACTSLMFAPASAEIYKYVDQNGIVHFTDNPSTVPESYRGQLERSEEVPRPWPPESTPQAIEATDSGGSTYGGMDEQQGPKGESPGADASTPDLPAAGEASGESVEELSRKRNDLMDKKAQLNQEYQSLLKLRRELEAEHESLETPEAVEKYNQQVQVLNEKIEAYREKRNSLEMEIQEFNAALTSPEEAQQQ